MKANIFLLIFALIFMIQSIVLAGGSVIGNGAGIVENNFQFAYQNLHSTFSECITKATCELTEAETTIVRNMRKVIEINRSNENRFVFISGNPDFFKTGEGENHRVAKTGLEPETPIYVNLDLLYTIDGKPAFDLLAITSILVHELGHQTGETNHAKLDIIGSKIRKNLLKKVQSHVVHIEADQIEVSIINRTFPFRASDMTIAWQGVGSITVTQMVLESVKCKNPENTLAGIEIVNGHYTYLKKTNGFEPARFGFGFWAVLNCYSKQNETFQQEEKQIEIEANRDLEINVLSVQDL